MKNSQQRSLEIEGISHGAAPIPMGARVGQLLVSSGIPGADQVTGKIPEDTQEQVRLAFANMSALLAKGGAKLQDVAKLTVYVKDNSVREHLNTEWLRLFPHHDDRPARHTVVYDLQHGMKIQLEVMAFVGSH